MPTCSRDSYLRDMPKPSDLYYELPGMADLVRSKGNPKCGFGSSAARDSIYRAVPERCNVIYDVPGMADMLKRKTHGTVAFRPGPSSRTSYIPKYLSDQKGCEVIYNVPGMSEEVARSRKGRIPDAKSSPCTRDSYLRDMPKPVDLYYELPGMADLVRSKGNPKCGFGSSAARDSIYRAVPERCNVIYDVPGMADMLKRKTHGTVAFRPGPSSRTSHIDPLKFNIGCNLIYDCRQGIYDIVTGKRNGHFPTCCQRSTEARMLACKSDNNKKKVSRISRVEAHKQENDQLSPVHVECFNSKKPFNRNSVIKSKSRG